MIGDTDWVPALTDALMAAALHDARAISAGVIASAPDDALALATFALVAAIAGDLEAAAAAASRARVLDPRAPLAWIAIGRVYFERDELVRAEDAATIAKQLGADPLAVDAAIYARLLTACRTRRAK